MAGSGFDARTYWEERLAGDYSLTGVGFRRLGPSFNKWAYRVRRERFLAAVRRLDLDPSGARVVDVGSGTGFYVSCWQELGASVTGLDLTETAVAQLAKAYPDASFVRADVSEPGLAGQVGTADAVSAMDVLFHVVDDAGFERALANIHDVLRPGGYFLYSDMFVHGQERRTPHRVARPLAEVQRLLTEHGFEVVERKPLFVLMNDPLDSRNPLFRGLWYGAGRLISASDRLGEFAGRKLYPVELRLTEKRAESPSTELMVARRR